MLCAVITVQHGSIDNVVRATSVNAVKYRKWRWGGPVTLKPLNQFSDN